MIYERCAGWGAGGRLWSGVQSLCIFNGLVDGFAEILIISCYAFAALPR